VFLSPKFSIPQLTYSLLDDENLPNNTKNKHPKNRERKAQDRNTQVQAKRRNCEPRQIVRRI
jgi:hypothetical protein